MSARIPGPGPVGLLCLQAVKAHDARVVLIGTGGDEHRLALGQDLGADVVINSRTDSLNSILEMTDGLGADVAIECAGSEASLDQCIRFSRKAAQIVTVGLPGQRIAIDLDQAVTKELTIIPSFTYSHMTWKRTLKLLEAGTITTGPLVTSRFPLTDWQTAFETVRSRQGIKCLLLPTD